MVLLRCRSPVVTVASFIGSHECRFQAGHGPRRLQLPHRCSHGDTESATGKDITGVVRALSHQRPLHGQGAGKGKLLRRSEDERQIARSMARWK